MTSGSAADEPELRLVDLHHETRVAHSLMRDSYSALAVQEAAQRYINRVQEIAGRHDLDGVSLINHVFSENTPLLTFSARKTPLEANEHRGYHRLAVGLVTAVRNVLAHQAGVDMDSTEALEWLAFISVMHRRLDRANRTPQPSNEPDGSSA